MQSVAIWYMIVSMDSNNNTPSQAEKEPYPILTSSIRPDQWLWIEEERVRQRHGNRSRLVQDALDLYIETMETRNRLGRTA